MTIAFLGEPGRTEPLRSSLATLRDRRERLAIMAELSWHLRQSDPIGAREYVSEAQAILRTGDFGDFTPEIQANAARCFLALSEIEELAGDGAAADAARAEAMRLFDSAGDLPGAGDSRLLGARSALERGDLRDFEAKLTLAEQCYARAEDETRKHLPRVIAGGAAPSSPLTEILRAVAATLGFGPPATIIDATTAYEAAKQAGLMDDAAVIGTALAGRLRRSGDVAASLDLASAVIDFVRPLGRPRRLALAQLEAAECLREIGRIDDAAPLLEEAAARLDCPAWSADLARAQILRCDLEFARGNAVAALDHARAAIALDSRAVAARHAEAQALFALGAREEAAAAAEQIIAKARALGCDSEALPALELLAEIRSGTESARELLRQALGFAEDAPPDRLLKRIAAEYAAAGDHVRAYEHLSRVLDARKLAGEKAAQDRANALQFRIEAERRKFDLARERERLRTADRLNKIMEASPIPLSITRIRDGRIIFRNRVWNNFFEVDPSKKEIFAIDHLADQADSVRSQELLIRNGGQLLDFESRLKTATGIIRWTLANRVAIEYEGEPAILSLTVDITERKATEDALRRAQILAEEASKAKSNFLASMSHEIRTPMNAVVGLAELLSMSELNAEQREMLALMRDSAGGLLRIIDDVLDFSKIEAGKLRLDRVGFLPASVAETVVQSLIPAARGRGLDLALEVKGEVGAVFGDPVRFRQILFNLAGNAIKFTEAGSVAIRLEGARGPDGRIALTLAVSDTGIGIAEDAIERLFEPFTQADENTTRRFGGTGLGLSICRRLVEAMGGAIRVTSKVGAGTIFEVAVALDCAPDIAPPAAALAVAAAPRFPGLKILVAEDQAANRSVLRRQFLRLGITAQIVEDGEKALAALEGQTFDLLITDCHMPGIDGFELTRRIRAAEAKSGGHLPILALTASVVRSEVEYCLKCGMDGYLSKPATIGQLADKISEVLRPDPASGEWQVDFPALSALAGEDDPFELCAIVGDYLETADPALAAAAQAIETGDFAAIQAAAHAGKGSAISVCARPLAECWHALEKAAAISDARAAGDAMAEIRARMVLLKAELDRFGRPAA